VEPGIADWLRALGTTLAGSAVGVALGLALFAAVGAPPR
jgi:hypothetical protein